MIDVDGQFPELLRRAEAVVRGVFPLTTRKYVLTASGWRWSNRGDAVRDDLTAQRKAKLHETTITARLVADLELTLPTGKVVDRAPDSVVLRVPHVTARSSFIVDGKELQVVNQLRLRPGLYTRFTIDDNVETFVNTSAAGTYRVLLDRSSGKFQFRVGAGQHFTLYAVLRACGVSDARMRETWGPAVFDASANPVAYPAELHKLFHALRPYAPPPPSDAEAERLVAAFLDSKPLDPDVNRITLGTGFRSITGDALLAAAQKCLQLSRGKTKADDPESLAFKSLHSVEDFVPERLTDALPGIKHAIATRLDRDAKIKLAVHPGVFSAPVLSFFATSEFARHSDQSNPVDMTSTNFLTTTMGEGGIGSTHAVTDAVRLVHPSHIGLLDPIHTPEGQRIGITGHLTLGAQKQDGKLALDVVDAKTGRTVRKTVQELDRETIAFPGQYDLTAKPPKPLAAQIKGRRQAELTMFRPAEVRYILRDAKNLFGVTTNMVPFMANDDGNRVGMADRHIEQAISLKNPDRPLVQAEFHRGQGYEDAFGAAFLPQSPVAGTVRAVTPDYVEIATGRGKPQRVPLHNQFPLNSSGWLHDTPIVKPGDKVIAGQRLAENNFTQDGALAMGKNLKIAYMPFQGRNFEDGVVVSEAAAHKLTSVHKHEERLDRDRTIKHGLSLLLAHFPDQAALLGDRSRYDAAGLIRVGAQINHGDVLIPAVRQQRLREDYDYAKLHKALANTWTDCSVYWTHDHPGKVTDVVVTPSFIKVLVETEEPAVIGDKLSMRHGGKGIITTILPDNEMYRDASGAPIDVLFNPTGIPGRVNPGQMFEAATGKLARQTGKPYIVKNFDDTDTLKTVRAALRKAGMDEHGEETVTDPTTGRTYPRTMVGDTHFLKLKHQVEKKFSARGIGGAYTLNDQPAKMDEESAQRIGGLELYSLLSGDATQFVDDAFQIKGQRNDEYWRALQLGLPLPKPAAPLVADKFNAFLLGAGINLNRHGDKLKALPMTDAQTRAMSNGVIRQATAVTATDLKPERGGLFDPAVTGGVGGAHWAHIELPEPIVNPLMRKPVRALLGLTETELDGLVSGAYGLGPDGKPAPNTAGDLPCGGEAVASLLGKLDVERELTKTIAAAKATRSAPKLDQLNKRRRYLQALKTAKLAPVDAYMNRLVPIIPPKFRPIYPLPDGSLNVSDPVHGYREVLLTANALRDMQTMKVAPRHLMQLRTDMSRAVAGLVGTTEPLTREAHFKGFLGQLKGVNNKSGFFQSRVMSRTQDLSGRSTVIPDPKLNLDEVGLPEKMGLTIYKPFLVRRLSMLGYSPLEARELVEKGDPIAVKALHVEAQERPVVMNRAPSLHKFNMMAFKPRIVPGRAIQVNPLIVSGYNMDFDGDTVGMHVPVTEAARREALEKLLPSRNLLSPASLRVVPQPTLEMALGLYLMSLPVGTPRKATSETEVVRAYRDKKADVNTAFLVAGKTICAGQSLINQVLPAAQRISGPMTKTVMSAAIEAVAKQSPEKAPAVINALKDLGAHYVSEIGFSVSLRDLSIDTKARDRILAVARKQEKKTGFEAASREAVSQISRLVHSDKENRFVTLSSGSGALSGKAGSVNRMLATPVAVTDHRGQAIPVQIPKSYAEGHDLGSYWSTLPGARKGMMDKGLSTADTGYLTKLLVQANIDNRIVMADCQTREGVPLKVSDADAVGRYTTTGELLTADRLRRAAAKDPAALVLVRSPIKCAAKGGLCQRCFGLNETGQLYPIGFHIGVLAAQTIGEPSTQLALKQFHTGGSLAGKKSEGFPRVRELFTLPENIKNRAILAQRAGRVTAVRPGKAGGWTVEVDRVEHFVPAELGLRAKLGDQVAAGDQLSQRGALRPQDLLAATGDVDRVRKAVIDELDDNFRSSGVSIRRRIFETALKPMTDRVKVVDAAGSSDVHRGDVVSYNRVVDLNRDRKDKITIEPTMFGVVKVPHLGEDFIGRMMHERLLDTMRDAPALGLTSNIGPRGHPVARLAFGGARQIGAP